MELGFLLRWSILLTTQKNESGPRAWDHGTGLLVGSRPLRSSDITCEQRCLLLLLRLWACGQRFSVVQAQRHVHTASTSPLMPSRQAAIGAR